MLIIPITAPPVLLASRCWTDSPVSRNTKTYVVDGIRYALVYLSDAKA